MPAYRNNPEGETRTFGRRTRPTVSRAKREVAVVESAAPWGRLHLCRCGRAEVPVSSRSTPTPTLTQLGRISGGEAPRVRGSYLGLTAKLGQEQRTLQSVSKLGGRQPSAG